MLATLFFDLLLSLLIYLCINGLIFNFFYVPIVSTYYHVITIIRLLRKQHKVWWRTLVEIIYHFLLDICGVILILVIVFGVVGSFAPSLNRP